jgi:hypothetical protein
MRLPCSILRLHDGRWQASHAGSSLGTVDACGSSREEALTKLRDELQYRIELCPCTGASADTVELVVKETRNG